MRVDLNQLECIVIPWDFAFVIDGIDYPTARPSEADIIVIRGLDPKREAFAEAMRDIVFKGLQCPDLSQWDNDRLATTIISYTTYHGVLKDRKMQVIVDQVKDEFERPTARKR